MEVVVWSVADMLQIVERKESLVAAVIIIESVVTVCSELMICNVCCNSYFHAFLFAFAITYVVTVVVVNNVLVAAIVSVFLVVLFLKPLLAVGLLQCRRKKP